MPWVWSRGPSALMRSVQHRRILAQRAVLVDQRPLRQFLAAAACHQHLAFGDDRGGEIEHDRVLSVARYADAIGRGRQPLLDPAKRRHQQRARGVDEMDRDQPLGRGHFRPVADPADMSGIAQRDRGKAGLLAFLDADPDRLRPDGLSVAEFAVDHRQRRRIDHQLDGLVGNDRAHLLPPDIDRHADHAVAVMPGEIGCGEIGRDAPGFFGRRIRMAENLRNEVDQIWNLDRDHVWIFAPVLGSGPTAACAGPSSLPCRFSRSASPALSAKNQPRVHGFDRSERYDCIDLTGAMHRLDSIVANLRSLEFAALALSDHP